MTQIRYRLDFGSDLKPEAVLQFVRSLSARQRHGWLGVAEPVVMEASTAKGQLAWHLSVSKREHGQVLGNLRLALPDIRTTPDADEREELLSQAWELRVSSARRPLRTDTAVEASTALLAALELAQPHETIILQWLIGPWLHRPVPTTAQRPQQQSVLGIGNLVLTSEQVRALRQKHAEPLFGIVGRIAVTAATRRRAEVLRQQLVGALQLVRAPGAGFQRRLLPGWLVRRRFHAFQQPVIGWPCVLSASELTSCLAWPIGNPPLEGVSYSGHRQLPPPPGALVKHTRARVTGRATFPGREGYLAQPVEAALSHSWTIGPTGTGKSTWLAGLALQDIAAGRGVVVVDPSAKGDLIRDIGDRIPSHRLDDVVLLDPSDERPVGVNVLSGDPDGAADAVVHVIHDLYAAHWGPRTADVLHHGLLTLTRRGGMTLCELPPLLTHAGFRRQLIATVRDDHLGVGPFWAWFEALSDNERAAVIGPVLNKLRQFTQRPAIRAMIGQHPGFDLREVFTKRKVLLVQLSPAQVGSEAAQLLGALLVGQLWRAVQGRGAMPPERRHPVLIYLDEFQQLLRLPLDLGDALVQARGLGVSLTMAHQHLGQLTPTVRAAVLANARSKVVFQLGHDDASVVAKHLGGGLTPADLQQLGRFETYQAVYTGHGSTRPASAVTLPLPPSLGSLSEVQAQSRAYGQARADVDAELLARRSVGRVSVSGPIGSRRREVRP